MVGVQFNTFKRHTISAQYKIVCLQNPISGQVSWMRVMCNDTYLLFPLRLLQDLRRIILLLNILRVVVTWFWWPPLEKKVINLVTPYYYHRCNSVSLELKTSEVFHIKILLLSRTKNCLEDLITCGFQ